MILLLSLLSACSGDDVAVSCADLTPPPVVACFGGDTVDWPGYGTLDREVEGTVVGVTAGRPAACAVDIGNGTYQTGVTVEIEGSEGERHVVGLAVPDLAASAFAEGDYLVVHATYTYGEFGPDVGSVTVARDTGATAVAIAAGGALDDLPALPGVESLAEGASRCAADEGCGAWSKYDVEVTAGGETTTLGYGETLALPEGTLVHGGYERSDAANTGTCPDWYVAQVTVAVVGG